MKSFSESLWTNLQLLLRKSLRSTVAHIKVYKSKAISPGSDAPNIPVAAIRAYPTFMPMTAAYTLVQKRI